MWVLVILLGVVRVEQDRWEGGGSILGPTERWGKEFYIERGVTYNIRGQISAKGVEWNYTTGWVRHPIDSGRSFQNGIFPADFDRDGDVDLVGWKGGDNVLVFYENDGENNFNPTRSYEGPGEGNWGFLYGCDFDVDGDVDLVVCSKINRRGVGVRDVGVAYFRNEGGFNFTKEEISAEAVFFPVAGDIDNDRDYDLVLTDGWNGDIEVWKFTTGGRFERTQIIEDRGWRARVVDINKDGWNDLIYGSPREGGGGVKVILNNERGEFNDSLKYVVGPDWYVDALWIRDVNNDGHLDIICGTWESRSTDQVWWLENQGDGVSYTTHIVADSAEDWEWGDGGFCEDIDFDGKADIVTGVASLSWFRQITPDEWESYDIAPEWEDFTHWIYPLKLKGEGCFGTYNMDVLSQWNIVDTKFVWYENKVVKRFGDGELESSIIEGKCEGDSIVKWLYFGWEVCCPYDSAIIFQVRGGESINDVISTSWGEEIIVEEGKEIDSISVSDKVEEGSNFFQYKVKFRGKEDVGIVFKVWVTYECVSKPQEVEEKEETLTVRIKVKRKEIRIKAKKVKEIEVSVYNLSGRKVNQIEEIEQKGECVIKLNGLKSGVYFLVVGSGEGRMSKKFVYLK
jgi:hypothetical protein